MSSQLGYKVFQSEQIDFLIEIESVSVESQNLSTNINETNRATGNSDVTAAVPPTNEEHGKHEKHLREGVGLYQHTNYNGYMAFVFEPGSYSIADFKNLGMKNDDISSLRVAHGWCVELFEHHKYSGDSMKFTSDEPNLISKKWNDRASSFKVSRVGVYEPNTVSFNSLSTLYKTMKDAVVSLLVKRKSGFYIGSAFFVSHDGYLVTAAHNIIDTSAADRPEVILATVSGFNGSNKTVSVPCTVVGLDGAGDVAVLQAQGMFNQIYFHWGRSRDTPIGSKICTFGNPKGQDFQSFTSGRVRDNEYVYKGTIESVAIDAQIYEGCSGSPILDVHGQVIGIICFGISNGDGFSWGMCQHVMESVVKTIIRERKNYEKGCLDISWRPVDAYFLHKMEVDTSLYFVEGVYCTEDSASSDMKKNDVIVKINNTAVTNQSLASILWFFAPGQEVVVHFKRPPETNIRVIRFVLKAQLPENDTISTLGTHFISQSFVGV